MLVEFADGHLVPTQTMRRRETVTPCQGNPETSPIAALFRGSMERVVFQAERRSQLRAHFVVRPGQPGARRPRVCPPRPSGQSPPVSSEQPQELPALVRHAAPPLVLEARFVKAPAPAGPQNLNVKIMVL